MSGSGKHTCTLNELSLNAELKQVCMHPVQHAHTPVPVIAQNEQIKKHTQVSHTYAYFQILFEQKF